MNELINHLQYLIRRQNNVEIPGLGSFHSVELPPFISEDGSHIIPPTRKLYFEKKDDNAIVEDLPIACSYSWKYKITIDEAQRRIDSDVLEIKRSLAKNGMYFAGRLGQFYLKKDKIEFIANHQTSAFNPYYLFDKIQKKTSKISMLGKRLKSMAVVIGQIVIASGIASIVS